MKKKWGTFRTISKEELQNLVSQSVSVAQIMKHFDMVNTTGNQRTFWKEAKKLNIDATHFHRGKGSPLQKTEDHKNKLRFSKLEKYGITLQDCEKHLLLGNRWCNHHKAFVSKYEFSSEKRGTCRQCSRERNFEKTHNLPYDWYRTTIKKQNGGCAICAVIPESGKVLFLDHDHSCCDSEKSCGRCARGLLCNRCNSLIGWLECNKNVLKNALDYIKW